MTKEITLKPDLATMVVNIETADGTAETVTIDVVNLALIGDPVEAKYIPKGSTDWRPTPDFNQAIADVYNKANVIPGRTLSPSDAYHLYFEMTSRWAVLKKNMSFMQT